jgi:hypothetical protein
MCVDGNDVEWGGTRCAVRTDGRYIVRTVGRVATWGSVGTTGGVATRWAIKDAGWGAIRYAVRTAECAMAQHNVSNVGRVMGVDLEATEQQHAVRNEAAGPDVLRPGWGDTLR